MTAPSTRRGRMISSVLFAAVLALGVVLFRKPLIAWFSGKSLGGSAGAVVSANAGPFVIKASLDPDPPAQSGNALILEIRDSAGKPVDDAKVDVEYDMAAMGSMSEMKGGATISRESDGRYRAEFDLPMSGTWTLIGTIRATSGTASQKFSLTVGTKGLVVAGGSGSSTEPSKATPAASASAASAPGEIDHYTCSMHPSVRQNGPGKCPICGMDLIPVTKEHQEQGVVMIDESRRQLIGVRTGPVVEGPMRRSFRAVGQITYDESKLADVNLKVQGWITKLFVSQTGQRVVTGQPLFSLYSPELYNAQQDFLLATQGSAASTGGGASPGRVEVLARASRQRLHLLGLSDAQMDAISAKGAPLESVVITSPASGFVIEKNVVEGASVDPGMRLFRIAALNKVWVEVDVYEGDLPQVRVGQHAAVTLDYLPGHAYDAKVAYIYPYLDPKARTGRVRVELSNKDLDLRPGMYASVELAADAQPKVQVPASAVVYTGPRRLVFVDLGQGRFRPQEIRTGTEADGMYEVLEGLKPGDTVATSGIFLIAAEARISTAAKYWDKPEEDHPASADGSMEEMSGSNSMGVAPARAPKAPSSPSTASKPMRSTPTSMPAGHGSVPSMKPAPTSSASSEIVYSCPMHPEVRSSTPGKCPKCGMDLEPMPKGGGK